MTAIAIACSRFALFLGVALLMLTAQGIFTACVLIEALRTFHENGAVDQLFVAGAECVLMLSAFVGASDLVRIGSVASSDLTTQLMTTLLAWTVPVAAFLVSACCGQVPAAALLWQLAATLAVTALSELSNQTNDSTLIPSPGRSLARVFGILTVMK